MKYTELVPKTIGNTLKELMVRQQRTSKEVCRACNIRPATYSMWLNHKHLPRPENMRRLAGFFGISVEELIRPDALENPPRPIHPEKPVLKPADTVTKRLQTILLEAHGKPVTDATKKFLLEYHLTAAIELAHALEEQHG